MRILHICNDFSYSKVHVNLYKELDKLDVEQVIYHPLRDNNNIGKNVPDFIKTESKIIYSKLLRKRHRLLFHSKIDYLVNSLREQIDISDFDIQYATTLFSDGAIAYENFLSNKIPYVVAVRSTDVDLFLKYRPDLYNLGKKILLNASKIVFISPSLKKKLFQHIYFKRLNLRLEAKSYIMINGIDNFWLVNKQIGMNKTTKELLYVGRFSKYKNICRLIAAVEKCNKVDESIKLHLVGGSGDVEDETIKLISKYNWIKFHGSITERNKLLRIYNSCDFYVMPSFETFGLTYIEALSQGLPILYSNGYGIDGIIKEKIGIGANPNSIDDISDAIVNLIKYRDDYINNVRLMDFNRFDWRFIAKDFLQLIK